MRGAWLLLLGCFVVALPSAAHAYERAPRTRSFRSYLSHLRHAAKRRDVTAVGRLASADFTIGEELDRRSSLDELRAHPESLAMLARLVDHGACYRTGPQLVQCELPDPGPELDHTKRGSARTTLAIFERSRRGWRMNVFLSP